MGDTMKIIEQSHKIISISLQDNLLQVIEEAGRTCYKSEDKIGCTIKNLKEQLICNDACMNLCKCYQSYCEAHSSHKFIKMLIKNGHHAMIEFGDITVRFVTNRGVTHELVRHRLCSFAQESTRYVRYDGEMEFIQPVWCSEQVLGKHTIEWVNLIGRRFEGQINPELPPAENVWFWNQAIAERDYCKLLKEGWRPEQAREVLPNSLKTEIVVKANLREWRHIFQLRCSKKAHPQMRGLLTPLLLELQQKIPVVFDDIPSENNKI